MVEKDKKDIEDELDIEIIEGDDEIDESTPGQGIELNDDLFTPKPIDKSDKDEDDDLEDEDDDRKKMGKRAEKRIKKLLAQQRELKAQLAERDNSLSEVVHDKKATEYSDYERSVKWLENREKELEDFEKTVESSYKAARQNEDVDAEWAAQKAMQQIQAERQSILSRKEQFNTFLTTNKPTDENDFVRHSNQKSDKRVVVDTDNKARDLPAAPQPDRRAVDWWKKNPWFHGETTQERIMTSTALQINQELIDEGFNATTDPEEYYEALDSRIESEFPDIVDGEKGKQNMPRGKNSPVSGGGRRGGPRKGGKQKIRLTESMVARAGRLGVSIEDYAKQVQKLRDEGRSDI